MSLRYIDKNGAAHVISGLTPGGNLETGAVATREGILNVPALAPNNWQTATVTFSEAMPDADYEVYLDGQNTVDTFQIWNKTADGFSVNCANYSTIDQGALAMRYKAFKLYEVADAEQLYSTVQDLEAMVPSNASSINKFATINDLTGETRPLDRRLDDVEDVIPSSASISNKLATGSELNTVATTLSGRVSDIEDIVPSTASTSNKLAVAADVDKLNLHDCNIAILGDSNAYAYQQANLLEASLGDNVTIQKLAVGGATFANTGNSVVSQLANITTAPDYIILWCGNNDLQTWISNPNGLIGVPQYLDYNSANFDNTTSFGALNYTLCYIRNTYPKARVLGLIRTFTNSGSYQKTNFFWDGINRIYQKWNCPVLDLQMVSNITELNATSRSYYFSDSRHYNSAGLNLINSAIVGEFRNGLTSSVQIDNCTYYGDLAELARVDRVKNAIYVIAKVVPRILGNNQLVKDSFLVWNAHSAADDEVYVTSATGAPTIGAFDYMSSVASERVHCNWTWGDQSDINNITYTLSYYTGARIDVHTYDQSSIDYNQMTTTGLYYIINGVSRTNQPPSAGSLNACLRVTNGAFRSGETTIMQEYFEFNAGVRDFWMRRCLNGSWSAWFKYSGTLDE